MRLPILLLGLFLCFAAKATEITGRVVAIADGDTLTILDGKQMQHKIRLAGIDAPEKAQPFGQRAKQQLSAFAYGKEAKADCYKTDRYGRQFCTVYIDGQDIALAQLDAGMAWWFRRYAGEQARRERDMYEAAGTRAAADRTGLWQDREPVPPWEWRRSR